MSHALYKNPSVHMKRRDDVWKDESLSGRLRFRYEDKG